MIAFSCPGCGKSFSVKDEFAGREAKCPTCRIAIRVPAAVQPAVAIPTPAPSVVGGAASGGVVASPAAAPRLYFIRHGQRFGPLPLDHMQQKVASGQISAADLVWIEGTPQWVPAREIAALFPKVEKASRTSIEEVLTVIPEVLPCPSIDDHKDCPFCGERVLAKARKCKHCGEMLDVPSVPTRVRHDPSTDTFSGTMVLMVKLAMRAIQELGWKLDAANDAVGMVTFQTGISWGSWSGVSCSLNIEEVSPNTFRVTGTGKQNVRGGQLIALNIGGEAQSKARKAIDRMRHLSV